MGSAQVRLARRDETAAVTAALGRAFEDDPIVSYGYPDPDSRARRAATFMAVSTRALWKRREVHVTEDHSCVAIWAPPEQWKAPALATLQLVVVGGLRSRPRLAALRGYMATEELHPEEPHWYLELLGTVPEQRGKGLGADVLAPVLRRCDEEGVPAWAWSSSERNLSFYYRQGFEVLDKLEFTPGGPPIFPIRREPRPPEV